MSAYVIFDVDIRDPVRYQDFMTRVKPALEAAGGRYLARGGAHKVYEGDWVPRRVVLLEFPSVPAFESFYNGPIYQDLKAIRDEVSSARLVSVEGLGQLGPSFYPDAVRSGVERWPEGWASIRTLAVIATTRQMGLGEALTRECIRRAQRRRARAIGLHTASFMGPANRLYRRLGFRRSPDFDIGIAEMFTGHTLPPDLSWQAEGFQLDLEDV